MEQDWNTEQCIIDLTSELDKSFDNVYPEKIKQDFPQHPIYPEDFQILHQRYGYEGVKQKLKEGESIQSIEYPEFNYSLKPLFEAVKDICQGNPLHRLISLDNDRALESFLHFLEKKGKSPQHTELALHKGNEKLSEKFGTSWSYNIQSLLDTRAVSGSGTDYVFAGEVNPYDIDIEKTMDMALDFNDEYEIRMQSRTQAHLNAVYRGRLNDKVRELDMDVDL